MIVIHARDLFGKPTAAPKAKRPKPPALLRLARPEPAEAQVLRAVRQALQWHPAIERAHVHRVNSGAHVIGVGKEKRFVRYHDIEGMSDIWAWLKPQYGPRQLFVEVKRPSTRNAASAKQRKFLDDALAHGHVAFVAHSADDAIAKLNEQLGTNSNANRS